jgi:hypothetical protein
VKYKVRGTPTITNPLFSLETALKGVGLAYTFQRLALPYSRAGATWAHTGKRPKAFGQVLYFHAHTLPRRCPGATRAFRLLPSPPTPKYSVILRDIQ